MLMLCVPLLARSIADRYKDLLELMPYSMLCAYIATSLFGLSSFSELVRHAPWSPSLSTASRHLSNFEQNNLNRAMRRLRWSVLKKVKGAPQDWGFFFDTTANPKRVNGLPGRGLWATSKGNIFDGRNLVVLVVVNKKTGVAIPIAWSPCIKPKEDKENGKMAWEVVVDLIDIVLKEGFPRLDIGGDSWFDGVPFLQELAKRGLDFNIELKSSRKAKTNVSPKSQWKSLGEVFEREPREGARAGTREPKEEPKGLAGMKFIASRILWVRGSKRKEDGKRPELRLRITAVYNYPTEKKPFAFYATNNISKSGVWQWQMARWRWNIEVLFRDLKQNLAWGSLTCESYMGCDAFIVIPFLIVGYLRLDIDPMGIKSIGSMLNEEKQASLLKSIEFIIQNPKHGLYKKFKSRMAPSRACQKPIDSVAETKTHQIIYKAA